MGQSVRDWLADFSEELLLAEGFDDAVIGVGERCGQPPLVVYDATRCIEILAERDGMSHQDAVDFFMANTMGAWVGEQTPIFMWRAPFDK
jgi:hypothetical protein